MTDGHLGKLVAHASDWAGFRPEAISPTAIERGLRESSLARLPAAELLERAMLRDPELSRVITRAIGIGETYFYRHPEHFELLARDILPDCMAKRRFPIRAWSAGCATGEEAYSLAACLLCAADQVEGATVEVVGTDMVEEHICQASRGIYGNWSIRVPIPDGLLVAHEGGMFSVSERVRRVTRLRAFNLLDPLPADHGLFDVVMCRNVLVYLREEAARAVVDRVASAVAPSGVMIFATLDIDHVPAGFERVRTTPLNVFVRSDAGRTSRGAPSPAPAPVQSQPSRRPEAPAALHASTIASRTAPPRPKISIHPIAVHVRALTQIENGERNEATRLLCQLTDEAPEYVPGLLEKALLHVRAGEPSAASTLMHQILVQTEDLDIHSVLDGPLKLPVRYYRETARAFLGRRHR